MKTFFYEAMLRLHGSDAIEASMQDLLQYLKTWMPADRLQLNFFDRGLQAIQVLVTVTVQEASRARVVYPLDEAGRQYMERPDIPRAEIVNRFGQDPVAGSLNRRSGLFSKHSALVLQLRRRENEGGSLVLFVEGEDRYEDRHLALFSMLRVPFESIMNNVLRFDELNQIRELLYQDVEDLRRKINRVPSGEVVGRDFGLRAVMDMVTEVAPLSSPVLLLGETGVGKEVLANAVHRLSSRKDGPFVAVNCGAIPDSLMDSELFGHERGAFTGATTQKKGYFELADGGTIFLDEVGELTAQAQVRMLRVLQEKKIQRVGGTGQIGVNVRIIAATHQNLQKMIEGGRFRSDLWFRLHVFPIAIPPLRERKQDIPALVTHFTEKKRRELNLPPSEIAKGALETLVAYDWPGNVRELENVVERALILCKGRALTFGDLVSAGSVCVDENAVVSETPMVTLDVHTAAYIRRVLKKTQGKIEGTGGAAEILGVNHSTLRHRMKKLGVAYRKKEFMG